MRESTHATYPAWLVLSPRGEEPGASCASREGKSPSFQPERNGIMICYRKRHIHRREAAKFFKDICGVDVKVPMLNERGHRSIFFFEQTEREGRARE